MNYPIKQTTIAVFLVVSIPPPAVAGEEPQPCDVAHGERVFQKCAVCHSIDPDTAHGVGPNLHDTLDRPVGKVEGFRFSRRMRESEHRWTEEHLHEFLEDPAATYKRTRMAFGGLKNADDRNAVICYLKLLR